MINKSRRPYNTGRMLVDTKVFEFIKKLREQYPRLGKKKIKPLLNEYCQINQLPTLSESKIGRLIKRHNCYLYLGDRSRKGKQVYEDRKRIFGYPVEKPGDLFQVDTVVRFEHGIRRYIVTAIDVVSRFAFAYTYKNHASRSSADFLAKLIKVTPYQIKGIQTDNGSEFLHDFDRVMLQNCSVHFFTYPRCPKQNGCVERFNRTIQDDMVEPNRALLEDSDLKQFNNLLIDYLLFCNTRRSHKTLGLKSPINYLIENNLMSNKSVTSTGLYFFFFFFYTWIS